ncbi:OB-fold nucleic acid binding domain-containing protein [Phytomonospora sp. NPDC050363]|uniref:OB-fold nucleic acid binding domain-containing protein n=1 Tax=Phytomonospora sp. NPDC050363 TaxID=3155642 RepID=UPI0033F6EC8D
MSPLRRAIARLSADDSELDAQELQRECLRASCKPMGLIAAGEQVAVTGRLKSVTFTPCTNLPLLEALLYDGSDMISLVWLGRRRIAGIEPGRLLTARGRVALREERKVIYNPHYTLAAPTS